MKTLSISILCVFLLLGAQAQKSSSPFDRNDTLLIIEDWGGKEFIIKDTDFLAAETLELNVEGLEIVEYTMLWVLSTSMMSFVEKTNRITERFKTQIRKKNSNLMTIEHLKCVNIEGEIISLKGGFVIHIQY
jgi:hypothetical protein